MSTLTKNPAPANRTRAAIALLLVVMLAFAVMDGLTKVLTQQLSIFQILWFRSLVFSAVALALLAVEARTRGQRLSELARSRRPGLQFSRALLLVTESGMFMLGFKLMPLADVHAVNAVAPLLVVALSVPLLGEKVGPRRWAAVFVGFIGVLSIVRPGFVKIEPPVLLVLLAAAMWALYQIMVRLCARQDGTETTSLWTAVVGLAATSIIGPFMWQWPSAIQWLLLGVIALLGAFGHVGIIRAFGMTQPSLLQPYNYSLFVWAIVVGYVLFGDVPDGWTLCGAAIIVSCGLYAWHRERIRAAEERAG